MVFIMNNYGHVHFQIHRDFTTLKSIKKKKNFTVNVIRERDLKIMFRANNSSDMRIAVTVYFLSKT